MKIIVGLGNPGKKYLQTRHNVGFMMIDSISQQFEMECNQRKFQSLFCKKTIEQEEIILLKPQTFMNLSGMAVREVVHMYQCPLQDLMVVCDDVDLPLGKLRIRCRGGCGGHRGLEDIAAKLGSGEFARLRIGVGRPREGVLREYVLSGFSKGEEVVVLEALERACLALRTWAFEGIETCMNNFN
ncbi:MAG: aminoacyl-tRNA hydrolase [Candidatus Brocadiaceae bacterium]|nr:aminoacyl-tRNA hydrolase [Candidatus Brocadiaceae bacterium]